MPNLATGNILLMTVKSRLAGQIVMNTCHYRYDQGVGVGDDFEDFAAAFLATLNMAGGTFETIYAELSTSIVLEEYRLQIVHPTRYAPYILPTNLVGGTAGSSVPVNSAAVFTKRSEIATRYGVGSWHQAGLPASEYVTSTGKFGAGTLGIIATQLGNIMEGNIVPPGMGGFVHGVLWSYKNPVRVTDIVSVDAQETARVMRRRTVGLGI